MVYEKRFLSAEDALRWLVDEWDTAGNAGTITGKCVRDGELGTTPDGDVFGAGMDDRIHMRRHLKMIIGDGMDRMTRKILDVYLECGCVRTFPVDEDGEREPGGGRLCGLLATVQSAMGEQADLEDARPGGRESGAVRHALGRPGRCRGCRVAGDGRR